MPADARPSSRLSRGAVVLAMLAGCATPAPDVVPIEIRLGAGDPRCEPSVVRAARLTVLGDFAPEPTDTVELLTSQGSRDLFGLRPTLRAIRVEVDGEPSFRAIGSSAMEEARASGAIAVLPPLVPCTLLDPDAMAPDASTLVAHADGTAWIVGGAGTPRRIARIDPRADFADVHPDALFNRRVGATATAFGRDIIIAGGAAETGDSAHDSYERLGEDVTPTDDGPGGRLALPRRDHAAVRLGERVVLVGGRSGGEDDALVGRVEVIDPDAGSSELGPLLSTPRVHPLAIAASDGAILVIGGRALDGTRIDSVERIEPGLARARTLETTLPTPDAIAGLPLDRLFHVAAGEVRVVDLRVDPPRVELLARASEIVAPHALATRAGRVLLVGTSAAGRALAELWTPHLGTAQRLEITRDPRALLSLVDGTMLEIDGAGASLRAVDEPGPWASLPNDRLLFPSDLSSSFVVATSPSDLAGARATRSHARIGLGAIVLGTFSIELEGAGGRTLILRDALGVGGPVEVALDAEGNAFGPGCTLSSGGSSIVVVRAGERLELVREGERARCDDIDPDVLFHVEVELDRDAELRTLRVARRAS